MHPLRCLVVGAAVAAVVSLGGAAPVAAGKGGNNDTANLCNQGGWKTLSSTTGKPFKNQGDCVNDGAHGVAPDPESNGQLACNGLVRGTFTAGGGDVVPWTCTYPVPPNPSEPQELLLACSLDSGEGTGSVTFDSQPGSMVAATCQD